MIAKIQSMWEGTRIELAPAVFHGPGGVFHADTCRELRAAAAAGEVDLWAYGRDTYPGARIEDGTLPQLQSVGLWEAGHDQSWGLDWHRNEGIEISYLSAGRLPFSCEDEDYDLSDGSITVTRPWQPHRLGRPNVTASRLCWFIVDVGVRRPNQDWVWPEWIPLPAASFRRINELFRHNEHPVWQTTRAMSDAVARLEHTLRGDASEPLARVGLCVAEVILEMADLIEHQSPLLDPYLSSTERMVEMFFASLAQRPEEQWTVDAMAAACGLKKTRFVHYCRKAVNATPLEYLNQLRIDRSTELLRSTTLSVSEIALACGFQSSQYFATAFRRRTGATPTAFRNREAVK